MADSINSGSRASTGGARIVQLVLIVLGLVGLYYLYRYLFAPSQSSAVLISGIQDATKLAAITATNSQLPPIYLGGEFGVSTWINVNNWGFRPGMNKSIIRIGGSTFDSIRIYLSAATAQLMIKFDTQQAVGSGTGGSRLANPATAILGTATNMSPETYSTLTGTSSNNVYTTGPADNSCDILKIDMQRWIHLAVSVNGMTCDVYMDGKLVRSCVLDNYVNVDRDYKAVLLDDGSSTGTGGFGGAISTTQVYGRALTPDLVYQTYMAGPAPVTNWWDYVASFFNPSTLAK
jgi:Concanavalin A-like lectin/glucanases superfamily